jgi:hypothetical protein
MKHYGACVAAAAAAAATLIVPAALAVTHKHHVRHFKHHIVVVRHFRHTLSGRAATCPPGSTVTNYCTPPVVDTLFFTIGTSTASEPVSTNVANELVVAFVGSDGPKNGSQSSTVSGGGLTWHKAGAQNKGLGGAAEVWWAIAPTKITKQTITATASIKGYDEELTVVTFQNAPGIGAVGTNYSTSGAPKVTVTTTRPDSWVWATANDWGAAALRKVPIGQNAWIQVLDLTARKTFWTQSTSSATPSAGTAVTINDTAPTADPFNIVGVEIL